MFSFLLAVLLSMFSRLFFLPINIRASKWRRETLQISTAGIQASFIMALLSAKHTSLRELLDLSPFAAIGAAENGWRSATTLQKELMCAS